MVNPIEQQQPSMAYDAARAHIMPPVLIEPSAQPRLEDTPIKSAENPQQDYERNSGRGSSNDTAEENRQQAVAAEALRQAFSLLQGLKVQAQQAQTDHNTNAAREVAGDAADVAVQIHRIARSVPVGDALQEASELQDITDYMPLMPVVTTPPATPAPTAAPASSSDDAAQTGQTLSGSTSSYYGVRNTYGGQGGSGDAYPSTAEAPSAAGTDGNSPLDLARSGLSVAKEVVDTAAALPNLTDQDALIINASMSKVLDSMAAVESWAGQAADSNSSQMTVLASPSKVDIQA